MTTLLRAELFKLRTTRTFAAIAATAVGLSLLLVTLTATLQDDNDPRTLFTSDFSSFFILLLGAIGMTGEWRHRTITSTVLAAPDRLRLLAAKTLLVIVALALEPNLVHSAPEVGRFGPLFGAPKGILGDVGDDEVLATAPAVAVSLAWIGAAFAAAAARLRGRDLV
jgi:hypothetical protein